MFIFQISVYQWPKCDVTTTVSKSRCAVIPYIPIALSDADSRLPSLTHDPTPQNHSSSSFRAGFSAYVPSGLGFPITGSKSCGSSTAASPANAKSLSRIFRRLSG